jgi:hypothetical protein
MGQAEQGRDRSERKVRRHQEWGLGGGTRSLFRAERALRRFLATFRGPVSAAHFGISGRPSSREAETGFDSEGRPVRSCNTPFLSAAARRQVAAIALRKRSPLLCMFAAGVG